MKTEFFKNNPHIEVVYVTSDDESFYQENDAKNHAKTLKDKTVEPVYNPFMLEVKDAEFFGDESETDEDPVDETPEDGAPKGPVKEETPGEPKEEAPKEPAQEETPAESKEEAPKEPVQEETPAESKEETPKEPVQEETPTETKEEAPKAEKPKANKNNKK